LGQSSKKRKANIERFSPTEPAARDEGPRLIPLDDKAKEPSRLDHYLELADSALGRAEEKRKED
jgi:hypothetical protein